MYRKIPEEHSKVTISYNNQLHDNRGYFFHGRIRVSQLVALEFVKTLDKGLYTTQTNMIFLSTQGIREFIKFCKRNNLEVDYRRIKEENNYYIFFDSVDKTPKTPNIPEEELENIPVYRDYTGIDYLHGRCDLFAVALYEVFKEKGMQCRIKILLQHEYDIDVVTNLHTYVVVNHKQTYKYVDITGVHNSIQDMLDYGGFDYLDYTEKDYMENYDILKRRGNITALGQQEERELKKYILNKWYRRVRV